MRQMLSEPGRVGRDALSIQLLIGEELAGFHSRLQRLRRCRHIVCVC